VIAFVPGTGLLVRTIETEPVTLVVALILRAAGAPFVTGLTTGVTGVVPPDPVVPDPVAPVPVPVVVGAAIVTVFVCAALELPVAEVAITENVYGAAARPLIVQVRAVVVVQVIGFSVP